MRLPLYLAFALAIFIAWGIAAELGMSAAAREMTAMLEGAEQDVRLGRIAAATDKLRGFERRWAHAEKTWAFITDHHEIDQVHLAVDRADRFLASRSLDQVHAELASLRYMVDHIPEKEALRFRSVF